MRDAIWTIKVVVSCKSRHVVGIELQCGQETFKPGPLFLPGQVNGGVGASFLIRPRDSPSPPGFCRQPPTSTHHQWKLPPCKHHQPGRNPPPICHHPATLVSWLDKDGLKPSRPLALFFCFPPSCIVLPATTYTHRAIHFPSVLTKVRHLPLICLFLCFTLVLL